MSRLPDFIPIVTFFKELAIQNTPTTVSRLLVAAGAFITIAYVSKFGESAMAAYGIALRIEQLILLPVISINIAAISLIGVDYVAMLHTGVISKIKCHEQEYFYRRFVFAELRHSK